MTCHSICRISVNAIQLSFTASVACGQSLDQIHAVQPNLRQAHAYGLSSYSDAAQTFTVGIAGLLSSIDVGLYRYSTFDETIIVDISRVSDGIPDFSPSGILARRVVSNDTVPVLSVHDVFVPAFTLRVDFLGSRLTVQPGDTLAVILRPTTSGSDYYSWWANVEGTPSYPRGSIFHRSTINGSVVDEGGSRYDSHFRTYVVIPEPATVAYSFAALLYFAARWQRR